jgi:hypothetical protein
LVGGNLAVLGLPTAGNDDAIEINKGKVQASQHVVHHPLKCVPRIADSKRGDEFKKPNEVVTTVFSLSPGCINIP